MAADDPFLQVGPFGADGGVGTVAGVDECPGPDEQPVRIESYHSEVGEGTSVARV
jgi:hypothetical protein